MEENVILSDDIALQQVKPSSREAYKKAFNRLREFARRDFEDYAPTEQELIQFFLDLRNEKKAASSTPQCTS